MFRFTLEHGKHGEHGKIVAIDIIMDPTHIRELDLVVLEA